MDASHRFTPLDGKVFPRFSGIRTFFRLPELKTPEDFAEADVAIVGVPFDGGASFRPGARFAPERVRSISTLGRGLNPAQGVHIFKSLKVGDAGDVPVIPTDIAATHASIHETILNILRSRCMPMMIGGDHSTTIGSMQAVFDHYGPMGVVHFDAHTDTYPAAWGCDIHHGTFMRLGHERGWFRKNDVIQIGIRGPYSNDNDIDVPKRFGYCVFTVDDIRESGLKVVQDRIKAISRGPVYVSLDVDCMDPAFAPGTGTPVPGGLTSWEVIQLLRALSSLDVVAADIVEVSPQFDVSDITSLAAVTLMGEILSAKAKHKLSLVA